MVAKRFMYVCVGLLAIAITFELGAKTASGQSSSFRVIGTSIVVVGNAVYHLDISNSPYGWKQLPDASFTLPPVAPSSLVQYEYGHWAITDAGEGWGMVGGVWTDLGPIPTVAVQKTTWGSVKARYAR